MAEQEKKRRTSLYLVDFDGKTRLVEASGETAAIAHCARVHLGSARIAKTKEIADFMANGGVREIAGQGEPVIDARNLPLGGRRLDAEEIERDLDMQSSIKRVIVPLEEDGSQK